MNLVLLCARNHFIKIIRTIVFVKNNPNLSIPRILTPLFQSTLHKLLRVNFINDAYADFFFNSSGKESRSP